MKLASLCLFCGSTLAVSAHAVEPEFARAGRPFWVAPRPSLLGPAPLLVAPDLASFVLDLPTAAVEPARSGDWSTFEEGWLHLELFPVVEVTLPGDGDVDTVTLLRLTF